MKKHVRHRVSVVVVHNGALLGFHAEDPHSRRRYFFIPGGKIEKDELPHQAAVRETLEETGYAIEVLPDSEIFRQYEFEWDGQVNECHTLFFVGRLLNEHPAEVRDAAYHRGVSWLPIAEIKDIFAYQKDILEPVQALVEKLSK